MTVLHVLICISVSLATAANVPPPLKNTIELLRSNGFEGEEHEVKSADGYLLTLHRIPSKNPKAPVVFIQHGLMGSSDVFILTNYSLGYALSKSGNDVWIGNFRGNIHSRKHEKLPLDSEKYWDFSWHEMGTMDLPAMIDYVLKKTGQSKLHYIGHSMGTTAFFVMVSEKPEYNSKVKNFIALGPIVYCTKYLFMTSNGSAVYQMVSEAFEKFKNKELWEGFPREDAPTNKHQVHCSDYSEIMMPYCEMIIDVLKNYAGSYVPAGSSMKVMQHYTQSYATGKIRQFDFESSSKNKEIYKKEGPPEYNLKNVKIPVYLFYGASDQVLGDSDMDQLAAELPNVALKYKLPDESFNHYDFLVKTNSEIDEAFNLYISKIIEIVRK